jgi:ATPase family associated with various cellular activities (AAA)
MTAFNRIRDFFGAALPVVALDSPSAEELTTIEKIHVEVGKRLKLPVYVFDLAAGLRQVVPVQEASYFLEDGSEFEGEVFQHSTGFWTGDPENGLGEKQLRQETRNVSGIDMKPIATQFRNPLIDICKHIETFDKKGIFVLVDLHHFLSGDRVVWEFRRYVKHLATALKQSHKRVVLLGSDIRLDADFSGLVYDAHNLLPELAEIQEAVNLCIDDVSQEFKMIGGKFKVQLDGEAREAIFTACRGLSIEEALNALRIDMRSRRRVDAATAAAVTLFKIEKLEKLNIRFSPAPDVVPGGVQEFKAWVQQRKRLFNVVVSKQPTKLKLPTPRGCLIVGPSGTGKSLLAKTLGNCWNIPILQVDIGSFYSSLVGETEANFRRFTRMVDHIGPCVVLLDEVEKALAGVGGQSNDSGVSQRLFGSLLTWMNDKTSPCFVVATANNIEALPPEFKRKGRFDEIWFVDTPNNAERREILTVHLSRHSVEMSDRHLTKLVQLTEEFVGAELGQVTNEAAIIAAELGLDEIHLDHMERAIAQTVPLARSQAETLAKLRQWAETAARPASRAEVVQEAIAQPTNGKRKPRMLMED